PFGRTPPGPPQGAPGPAPRAPCTRGLSSAGAPAPMVRALGGSAMTVSLEQLRRCHFAVDLGAARTRVYVRGTGIVVDEPSVAAEAVDRAIVPLLRHEHELMLPSQSVRPLQLALSGTGLSSQAPQTTEIHGRDVVTGLARSVRVSTAAVRNAIRTPLTAVLDG